MKNSKVLFLDITNKCNLRCQHCYNSRYFGSETDLFSYSSFINMIYNKDIERIHILGGEPLISHNLFSVLDYARSKNIKVSINTNGYYLERLMFEKISRYQNVDQITVSLDGGEEEDNDFIRGRGVFRRVIENLQTCNKIPSHIKINIACVITDKNLKHVEKLANLDIEYSCLLISMLFDEGNAKKNYKTKLDGDQFFEKLCFLIPFFFNKGIRIQVDLSPIGLWWLELLLKQELKIEVKNEDCLNSKLFYSADNKLYICNPSSFLGDDYQIIDMCFPEIRRMKCRKNCVFQECCEICSINCDHTQIDICQYVLDKTSAIFDTLFGCEIVKSKDYEFVKYRGKLLFINFRSGKKYILCGEKKANPYKIQEYYMKCDMIEKRQYKVILAGLCVSGQIVVKKSGM